MRLSDLFETHVVITDDYAYVVRMHATDDGALKLAWDNESMLFDDQAIDLYDQTLCTGMFSITDTDGEDLNLIALQEAELRHE